MVINPGDTLTCVLAGAKSANDAVVSFNYSDGNTNRAVSNAVNTNGATPVTILQPVAANGPKLLLDSLVVNNLDNAPITFSLIQTIGGNAFTVRKFTIPAGGMATIGGADGSLHVADSTGATVSTQGAVSVVSLGIPVESGLIWDATTNTQLGTTPTSADDYGVTMGTYGTTDPTLRSSDAKTTTVTSKVRYRATVPANYVAGQPFSIRLNAGMVTTVANGTATIVPAAYRRGAPTVNIVTTAAQSINTLLGGDKDFVCDPTNLVPGDVLDIVVTQAITDSATITAVIGELRRMALRPSVRV
jgi:hypothetical protein